MRTSIFARVRLNKWLSLPLLFMLIGITTAQSAQLRLAWDPSPDPEAAGYTLKWGTSPGSHTKSKDVGAALQHTLTGLTEGEIYYLVVTAYDSSKTMESPPSNQVAQAFTPKADFSATPTSGQAPLAVTFVNQSVGTVTDWSWDFGDGNTSTARNPSHTYASPGTYTVKLIATSAGGSDFMTATNMISVSPGYVAPVSDFTVIGSVSTVPHSVSFSDKSTGDIASWMWDFGDGNSSTQRNPTHTYVTPGIFTVSLTVGGQGGSDTKTVVNAVTITQPGATAPVASFVSSTTSGPAPLTVTFTDTSSGDVDSRQWDFGDGNKGSGATAIHTYSSAGNYTVGLTATGSGGTDSATKSNLITVTATPLNADFAEDRTEGSAPLTVRFTDLSEGDANSWFWEFGDGGVSTTQFPTHTYQEPGNYTVVLTAGAGTNAESITKTNLIQVSEDDSTTVGSGLVAAFGFEDTNGERVSDLSGNGHHGTVTGAQLSESGRFGNALRFDGVNDWVTIVDSDKLDLTDGMTLEAWVRPNSVGSQWQTVLIKEQAGGPIYYLSASSHLGGPAAAVYMGGEQIVHADSTIAAEEWTHLAATYDGSVQRLYINGKLTKELALSGQIQTSREVLRIGGNSIWGEHFAGQIDEVRIYDRALSSDEIQLDMVQAVAGFFEFGTVDVNHNWKRIDFARNYADPIVVAKGLTSAGSDPATARVRNVDDSGFDVRIQEWDYLDDSHVTEQLGYLVMERGTHTLPDGSQVEAGRTDTLGNTKFQSVAFDAGFQQVPVVTTTVTSFNEIDAVVTRQRNISKSGFEMRLQEQELNLKQHAAETVDYVAWEPSTGLLDDVRYEVGRTADKVKHNFLSITFTQSFGNPPTFIADMQTQDGADTANLRVQNKNTDGVEVRVAEEQSRNSETNHTTEVVGFMVFGPAE